jgi:hypothetical protein
MPTLYDTQKFQVLVHPRCAACCFAPLPPSPSSLTVQLTHARPHIHVKPHPCDRDSIAIIIAHGAADTHTHTHTHIQVKPHPCDRDYQHIQGLEGCSPVFSASSLSGAPRSLGIVDMEAAQRVEMPRKVRYGTYAQTLQRSGYINMLGRPPFNYSIGSPKRKSGFLSADTLLDPEGKSTIFQPCKTVPQCFMDRLLLLARLHAHFILHRISHASSRVILLPGQIAPPRPVARSFYSSPYLACILTRDSFARADCSSSPGCTLILFFTVSRMHPHA